MAMPLGPYMMWSAARIIGDLRIVDPKTKDVVGTRRGPIGTGFFVRVPSEADDSLGYTYLVTAHHVIVGETNIEVEVANPFMEGALHAPLPVTDWRPTTSLVPKPAAPDIAIAPFKRPADYGIVALEAGKHLVPGLGPILPGAHFYYVGLLAPLDRPMARSGTIGAVAQTGLASDLYPYDYVAHLVDCRSYGGFSGSPCYLEYPMPGLKPATPQPPDLPSSQGPVGQMQYQHTLCGMFTAHLKSAPPEDVEDEVDERYKDQLVSRYGVGVLLHSDHIWEALMNDQMRQERAQMDANIAKAVEEGGSTIEPLGSFAVPVSNPEFENFDALASKLVQVPKSEIDAKRKQDG